MAKRKKGKIIQMLSPEKYIKQKARNLPVHECWINTNWEESGLGNIFVTRKHSNGNLTIGIYLVDFKCLGVKDAYYLFNLPAFEFETILDNNRESMDMEKIDYKLAHNIVFAGIEFADDYGFKPHKDFGVAQYILEEDTDEIELMEIECGGDNGQPLFVRGPLDSDVRAAQIIAQLEKTAGKGNYDFLSEFENKEWENDEWDDDHEEWDKEMEDEAERLEKLPLPEKIKMFHSLIPRLEKLSDKEKAELGYLSNSIIEEYTDFEKTEEVFDQLLPNINNLEITEAPSDKLLGTEYFKPEYNREEWAKTFEEIIYMSLEKPKIAKKKIKSLQKEMPGNPAVAFLKLNWLQNTESKKYESQLMAYREQFPNYPLINILWAIHLQLSGKQKNAAKVFENGPTTFFQNQKHWHGIEVFHYLLLLTFCSVSEIDLSLVMVVDWLIEEIELTELDYEIISQLLFVSRTQFIMSLEA